MSNHSEYSQQNTQTHPPQSAAARRIALIHQAHALARLNIVLGSLAVAVFLIFGTLASMAAFGDNTLVFWLFYYAPYVLIGLSLPISLYHLFLMHRYRLIQPTILALILGLGLGLGTHALMASDPMGRLAQAFLALLVWFSVPFLVKLHLGRFLKFLQEDAHEHPRT